MTKVKDEVTADLDMIEGSIEHTLEKFLDMDSGVTVKQDGHGYWIQIAWRIPALVGVGYPNKQVNRFAGDGINQFANKELRAHLQTYFKKVEVKSVKASRVEAEGSRYRDHAFVVDFKAA